MATVTSVTTPSVGVVAVQVWAIVCGETVHVSVLYGLDDLVAIDAADLFRMHEPSAVCPCEPVAHRGCWQVSDNVVLVAQWRGPQVIALPAGLVAEEAVGMTTKLITLTAQNNARVAPDPDRGAHRCKKERTPPIAAEFANRPEVHAPQRRKS